MAEGAFDVKTSLVRMSNAHMSMEEAASSRSACARMMRCMLALQPYSPVVSTHGDSSVRLPTTT